MNAAIQNLANLQAIEFGEVTSKNSEDQVSGLRARIPAPILAHYDRLRARAKKGVAAIRNQVCSGCHMKVPIGQITAVMRGEDIQLCETCGRYLYMAPEQPATASSGAEAGAGEPAKAKVPRKRKAKVAADTV